MWYAIYDNVTKEVKGAAFFANPQEVPLPDGCSMSAGQSGDIPSDLIINGETVVYNYIYNTETQLVEAKA